MDIKDMFFGTVGGLGLFLFGMQLMTDGLKKTAGQKLKSLLEALTRHRLIAVLMGAFVTCLIQSSSATTVMTVGLVNAGLLTLRQALCVVLGANIGTTFTAWLVSAFAMFKISSYALPMIGVGFLFSIVGRSEKARSVGQIMLGFGLLFMGIHFMKEAFAPLEHHEGAKQALIWLGGNPILAVLAGTILTMLLQSSSASIAMIQTLAFQGAFGTDWDLVLRVAVPFILGDNIGTTITAQIAALRTSRNARRTAMGHTMFNVIGVLYILPFVSLGWFADAVEWVAPFSLSKGTIMVSLAIAHSMFNVFNTIVFLPLMRGLEIVVMWILPVKADEVVWQPVVLERHLLNTPVLALAQARREIVRMAKAAEHAVTMAVDGLLADNPKSVKAVREIEDQVDSFQLEITSYLSDLSQETLSESVSTELPVLLHAVNDLERVGDHAVNIAEIADRKMQQRLSFSGAAMQEAGDLRGEISTMFADVIAALESGNVEQARPALASERKLNQMQVEFRRSHVARMTDGICSAVTGLIFIDLVDNVEKIGDHLTNIAQAIIGGLQWEGVKPKKVDPVA
ncbi:MAG: Na/Pi cotransporter family protein [Sedimentisphaerales bacterium]|nr:Na/Pi cotransporter family protein [Sedimentisphaerales bacterium]